MTFSLARTSTLMRHAAAGSPCARAAAWCFRPPPRLWRGGEQNERTWSLDATNAESLMTSGCRRRRPLGLIASSSWAVGFCWCPSHAGEIVCYVRTRRRAARWTEEAGPRSRGGPPQLHRGEDLWRSIRGDWEFSRFLLMPSLDGKIWQLGKSNYKTGTWNWAATWYS